MKYRGFWFCFAAILVVSFSVLGYFGSEIYRQAPPIPEQVVTSDGKVLFAKEDIKDGQNVWQSTGGQELGTVWGHGAYVAPDWTADWLHREAVYILNSWSQRDYRKSYNDLDTELQALLEARLKKEIRTNTYDPVSGNIVISQVRAEAVKANSRYYSALFGNDPSLDKTRSDYAIATNTLKDPERMRQIST